MMAEESKVSSSGTSNALYPTQAFATCPNGMNNDNNLNGAIRQYSFAVPLNVESKPGIFFGTSSNGYFYKQSDAAAPAQLLLMIEQNNGQDLIDPNSQGGIDGALKSPRVRRVQLDAGYIRHGGVANALFLDGHVAGLSPTDTDYSNSESKKKLDRWFTLK